MAIQMQPTIIIYNPATAMQVADMTRRARSPLITDVSISFTVQMGVEEAAQYIDRDQMLLMWITQYGRRRVYRLDSPTLIASGVRFEGYSPVVALADAGGYSELWSTTSTAGWAPIQTVDNAAYKPDRWVFVTNQTIGIVASKNELYALGGGNTAIGATYYKLSAEMSRSLIVAQVEWEFLAPTATWGAGIFYGPSFGGLTNLITPLAGSGAVQTGAVCATFTASSLFGIQLYYNSAVLTAYTGETGDCYFRIKTLRLATTTTNLISTTVTSGAILVGVVTVTITTGGATNAGNIYVGQRLVINSGAADSEAVVVTAATATTFTATFAKAHLAGATVRAIVVYDQEIVRDIVSQTTTLNPTSGLSASTVLIQSSGQDLFDKQWSGAEPLDVLSELVKPVLYRFGVSPEGMLYYHPRGTYARRWSVRAADIELARPLDTVYNSVRVAYRTASGLVQVTAYATNAASVAAIGLTRRRTIQAQTTSAAEAILIRDTALSDTKKRSGQSTVRFRRLFDESGVEYPADQMQPGDSTTITNLPPQLDPALRTFTIAEVTIDMMTGLPSVVPENPLPQLLDVLLARLAQA